MEDIGTEIMLQRRKKKYKQFQLAALLGVTSTYLSMVETGRIKPTQKFIEKCADILGFKFNGKEQ